MDEIKQIDIYDTLFGETIKDYDIKIKDIRSFGTMNNPLFLTTDVVQYFGLKVNAVYAIAKKYNTPKETVKKYISVEKKSILNKIYTQVEACNLLTKYGLIRYVSSRCRDTTATICFRRFIYALFDKLQEHPVLLEITRDAHRADMDSPTVLAEIKEAEVPSDQSVYFIKNSQYVKIGYASDVVARLSTLQVGSSDELTIYNTIKCPANNKSAAELERIFHEIFADYRVRGEWFNLMDIQIQEVLFNYAYN
jgi:hypothetical protein